MSDSFATLWPVAYQTPLSMGFPRQEHWIGLPFSSPGNLPDPGIKPRSPAPPAWAGRFFTTVPPGKPMVVKDSLYRLGNWGGRDLSSHKTRQSLNWTKKPNSTAPNSAPFPELNMDAKLQLYKINKMRKFYRSIVQTGTHSYPHCNFE